MFRRDHFAGPVDLREFGIDVMDCAESGKVASRRRRGNLTARLSAIAPGAGTPKRAGCATARGVASARESTAMAPRCLTPGAMADNRAVRFPSSFCGYFPLSAQSTHVYSNSRRSTGPAKWSRLNIRARFSRPPSRAMRSRHPGGGAGCEGRALYAAHRPEPDDAVRVALYRESGDRLEPVNQPYEGEGTQLCGWTCGRKATRRFGDSRWSRR